MRLFLGSILIVFVGIFCSFIAPSHAAVNLEFGVVYNLTFDDEFMYYQVFIPYNPDVPDLLRVAMLTYVPYETLNVSASFDYEFPNSTNNDYYGTNKDGSLLRGIVWINNIPKADRTLYISVARFSTSDPDTVFGLNIEWPSNILDYRVNLRYQVDVQLQAWQTKWFQLNFGADEQQFISAARTEFCNETGSQVTFSLIFPETNEFVGDQSINPCGCSDTFIEDREKNILTTFVVNTAQMFILPVTVTSLPVYGAIFYAGNSIPVLNSKSTLQQSCAGARSRRPRSQSVLQQTSPNDTFTARLSLYGQELFPSVLSKYIKPDKINDDLIVNVDDTAYCNFFESNNFTGYFSEFEFYSYDSACFLENHADDFEVIEFDTLVGDAELERVLIIQDYYSAKKKNATFFGLVHSNENCGSFSYVHERIPTEGWEHDMVEKQQWTPLAIGIVVGFALLFVVFFVATLLLLSRLREYKRYRKI